jgi:hypothetical protein
MCGGQFVAMLACPRCRRRVWPWKLARALRPADRRCGRCGAEMPVTGFSLADRIDASAPKRVLSAPLSRLGFRAGDVVLSLSANTRRHLELGEA